tara:strand:+ start:237 stop:875 length:639 start_codon:yes stop_codon:yes gene_type:complete
MAKISKYETDDSLTGLEKLLGTDVESEDKTRNYGLNNIKDFIIAAFSSDLNYETKETLLVKSIATVEQIIGAQDTETVVLFPSAQSLDVSVTVNPNGDIVVNDPQTVILKVRATMTKPISDSRVLFFTALFLNGIPVIPLISNEIAEGLISRGVDVKYRHEALAGDVFNLRVMLDSSAGTPITLSNMTPTNPLWGTSPIAEVSVIKEEIIQV